MKLLFFTGLMGVLSFGAFCQTPVDSLYTSRNKQTTRPHKEKKDSRWVYAGNVSFQPKPLFVNASPLIGYRFTDNFMGGMGPSYLYNKQGLVRSGTSGGTSGGTGKPMHVYGARAFVARRLYKQLFLQGETEALNYPYLIAASGEQTARQWVVNPLAGLSYNLALGGKSFFQLTVLYNFNYYNDPFNRQLYNSPWIFRLGAGIGNNKK